MKKPETYLDKGFEIIFSLIFFALISFLIIGFILLPSERQKNIYNCEELNRGWYQTLPDGSSQEVALPAKCNVEKGDRLILHGTLPEDLDIAEMPWLCFHSSLQDMEIYIDGVLRGSYSTKSTRLWGKNSVSTFYFVQLTPYDHGKKVEFITTTDSKYSGVANMVYCGTVFGIFMKFVKENAFESICAMLLLCLSIATIIISSFVSFRIKRKTYLGYLGWTALLLSAWILSESPLRQFYYRNISLAGAITHFAIYLMAIPILFFFDHVQNHRYAWLYRILLAMEIPFSILAAVLEITETADFSLLFNIAILLHAVAALCIFTTFVMDIRHGYAKRYKLIELGFFGFAIGVLSQLVLYMQKTFLFHGVALCIGAMFWLLMSILSSLRDYFELVRENMSNKIKAEELTWQAMDTLVQTIEAKDAYTKGHSYRVARYAAMLARKMGMSEDEQKEIHTIGMLHDIGKIGIADSIINKPGKLTDEEYAVIKSHPVIGYDILKNMGEFEKAAYGARWHHERYDGKGYPDGFSGEEIPLYARILAVADTYDAMTSNRSYRKVMPQNEVRAEIERVRGTQLDPEIAGYLLEIIDNDKEYQLRQQPSA